MIEKINCPYHDDDTPSMVLYADHAFCFGKCNKRFPLPDGDSKPNILRRKAWPKEDMERSLAYISNLPQEHIRGFNMPSDALGYYIVYPRCQYYTKRLYNPTSPSLKYRSPYGHTKLPYVPKIGSYGPLFVVEGQLNALSLAQVTDCTVVSPGGAGDLCRFVNNYLSYEQVCIIVDNDDAGTKAAEELHRILTSKGKKVIVLVSPKDQDLNHIYVTEGKEKLKRIEQRAMEMLGVQDTRDVSSFGERVKQSNGSLAGVDFEI